MQSKKKAEQTNQSNEIARNSGNRISSSTHEVKVIDQIAEVKEIYNDIVKGWKAKSYEIIETESNLNALIANIEKRESSFLSK